MLPKPYFYISFFRVDLPCKSKPWDGCLFYEPGPRWTSLTFVPNAPLYSLPQPLKSAAGVLPLPFFNDPALPNTCTGTSTGLSVCIYVFVSSNYFFQKIKKLIFAGTFKNKNHFKPKLVFNL